jgi:hypothetical protein
MLPYGAVHYQPAIHPQQVFMQQQQQQQQQGVPMVGYVPQAMVAGGMPGVGVVPGVVPSVVPWWAQQQ